MPLKWFICPDNEKIEVTDCLKESGCRVGDRCATRSYLRLVSNEREWTGKPSTTQLINGTMNAFLKLTKDFAVSPASRAFMIHGTKGHGNLESADDEYSFLEEKFNDATDSETGIADVFEVESGLHTLIDYKTSGSYKVARALGFYVDKEDTGQVYKSGKRKGEIKTRNVLKRDDTKIDRWEWEYQLNNYRIKFAKRGFPADQMKVMCIVRDGNTHIARSRGVFRNIYFFKIRKIPDKIIEEYFYNKRIALLTALDTGTCKNICTATENWNGLKCQSYCEVAEYCNYGKFLIKEKESEDMAIKGLSEIRRLPRLGKIRLGIKKKNAKGVEYPAEVDYFILDPQTPNEMDNEALIEDFKNLYGDQPKKISIMFPVANPETYFAQFYKRYGSSTLLKCKGDGETASCSMEEYTKGLELLGPNEMGMPQVKCEGRECTYYKKRECSEVGTLQILLPEMKGAGVWQITTGSFHSIVNINSCIEYIKTVCGRSHMIPLTLERRKQETQFEGKKANHYILHINMDFRLADLQRIALIDSSKILTELPAPDSDREDILFQENTEIESQTEEVVAVDDTIIKDEDLTELMNDALDMIEEEVTEPPPPPPPPINVTVDDKLKNAKDLNELKKIWEEVVKIKNSGMYSKDEVMDLVSIKEQRKRDLMSKK